MVIATLATVIWVLQVIIQIYIYVVIAAVIMSWLLAMGTLNLRNNLVRSIVQTLDMLTEPVFRRVRRIIPAIGPLDISPMIVIVILWAIGFVFLPILLERLTMGSLF
jgi:YggT family protein